MLMTRRSATRRPLTSRIRTGTRALAATAVLGLLAVGTPIALARTIGNPLPGWNDAVAGDVSDRAVLAVLVTVAWLAWAQFAFAVLVESVSILFRDRITPPIRGVLPSQQLLARTLIAAALVLPASLAHAAGAEPAVQASVTLATAGQPLAVSPMPAHSNAAREEPLGQPDAPASATILHTVTEGPSTYWDLARTYLDDAERWREIWDLNKGRRQGDGTVMTSPRLLQPGWIIRIPDAGTTETGRHTRSAAELAAVTDPVTVPASGRRHRYIVRPGDTLSAIAQQWLGDASRWPQICALNKHDHPSKTIGVLRDCDLIYPGWELQLPADARPPAARTAPEPSTPHRSRRPHHHDQTSKAPHPPGPERSQAPTPAPRAHPSSSAATPRATKGAIPTENEVAPSSSDAARPTSTSDRHGIHLGESYLPWSLATAIAAAITMVWLHRRRRHVPGRTDDDPTDLPPGLLEIDRQVARRSGLDADRDLAERAAAGAPPVPLPAGGVGFVGEGALAAARAALAAALASGKPHDPGSQGEVIVDAGTLHSLIDLDPAALGLWPRLHVPETLDDALTLVETHLLYRSRTLQDLAPPGDDVPDPQHAPPLVLIARAPIGETAVRLRAALALGTGLGLTALVIGAWSEGPTLRVDSNGDTNPVGGPAPQEIGTRVAVLDAEATVAILATLREAHTGQRPAISPPAVADHPSPNHIAPDVVLEADQSPEHSPASDGIARLSVFGTPRVENATAPGHPLRAKAAELAVFLACHPDGADTRTVGENLEPDVRLRHADTRVHTNVSNLRHVMGRAAGPRRIGYVIKRNGRYQLDRAHVSVDLWDLRDLLARAATAPPAERIELLTRACDLHAAPLAEGCDYDWVEPYREKARQQAIDAHLLLAELLMDGDPEAASETLDRAIRLDRYNERVYVAAMQARHRLGDTDGIRALLRALTVALVDLESQPDQATVEVANRLLGQPAHT
jgi:nucleoid-associated protein YgaU/DNA-binding SARP family transcriptional activator